VRIGVLASGEGPNLQAILDRLHGRAGIEVVAVASDKPAARALERARAAGVPARAFEHADRAERDAAIAGWLAESQVELVVLAGYMQLLGAPFLARFPQRVVNVHPALLPAFPGLRSVERAVEHGVKVFGVTVHFVDEGVDTGPIIAQRALELPDAIEAAEVRRALQPVEHELLTGAIRAIATGRVVVAGGRCRVQRDDAAG
jgi:phosphoribosylglycinamide formyltransferase-1